ncbi:AEC family transporter [Vibrio chagasii]|nr:AEC family transporter [Vibrio chagasii]
MFVFEVLLPLIFIVAVGFLTTKRLFSQQFVAEVSKFVLYVSLPAVIISSLSSIELGQVIQVNFMLVYAIAGLGTMTVAMCGEQRPAQIHLDGKFHQWFGQRYAKQ